MRHIRRRHAPIAVALVIALVAGFPATASAGITHWDTGYLRYKSGTSGGENQCADKRNHFAFDARVVAAGYSYSRARHGNGNCLSNFPLPSGWIIANSQLQVKLGSNWYNVSHSEWTNQASYHEAYAPNEHYGPGAAPWRNVTGHSVAILGGWQSSLIVSPSFS